MQQLSSCANEPPIHDPDAKDLWSRILTGQQAEIDEMKAKLSELGK